MSIALDNFRAASVEQLDINGQPLHYRVFGQGPAVLLLHGWPLSGVTYRHLVEALRPHYRCYVPDLPGAGATPWWPSISETIHGYTDAMRAFVDRLELQSFAVVGHDSGGGVARLLAAQVGARAKCLILQNTEVPDHVPAMVRLLKLTAASRATVSMLRRLIRSPSFRGSALGFGSTFGDRSLIEGEFYTACIAPLEADVSGHAAALAHLDFGWIKELPQVHGQISAKIHLFWGGSDTEYFPLERARAMQSQFASCGELEVVRSAKLYVHEEAHEALSRFCLRLLSQSFASRGASDSEQAVRN